MANTGKQLLCHNCQNANESDENKEKKKENAADFVELIKDMKKNELLRTNLWFYIFFVS
ncbi:MAG: hypothetical protein AB1391_00725 [Candidatus Micrarchaeota archaeon]